MKKLNAILAMCLAASIFVLSVPVSAEDEFVIIDENEYGGLKDVLIEYNGPGGEVIIPDGVQVLGKELFMGRDDITKVVIPDSVHTIQDSIFRDCSNLVELTFLGNFNGTLYQTGCDKLEIINLLGEHESIGGYQFAGISGLKTIDIPEGVTNIGQAAFQDCVSLESISLPASLTDIGYAPFYNCYALKEITLSPDNTSFIIKDDALICTEDGTVHKYFGDASEYVVPDEARSIASDSFRNNQNLEKITIPGSVETIGLESFSKCDSLKTIVIEEGVKRIEEGFIGGSRAVDTVYVPSSVEYIGIDAFHSSDYIVLVCEEDSYAAEYAKKNKIPYFTPDETVPAPGPGDANGDRRVNLSDVSLILRNIAGWYDCELTEFADVNDDGKTSLSDVSLILQYIAHWDVVLK